jgi:2-polyprenyl-3-methyl-5-hydroxy-6-metoxy-1,4-benzoquinol methylase
MKNAEPLSDKKVVDSWLKNATPWTAAVRERQIESRRLVTDQAIVDAVTAFAPRSVLDIGCGEGWLTRALGTKGMRVTGVDVVPALIDAARGAGGNFHLLSIDDLVAGKLAGRHDTAVCNFALFGKDSVAALLGAMPALLEPGGHCIVQTLHPRSACGDAPYADGWREGSWSDFSADFTDPPPWYFRTLESWTQLFADSGLRLLETRELLHPRTQQPASVIFIAALADSPQRTA